MLSEEQSSIAKPLYSISLNIDAFEATKSGPYSIVIISSCQPQTHKDDSSAHKDDSLVTGQSQITVVVASLN